MKGKDDLAGRTTEQRLAAYLLDLETATQNVRELACRGMRPTNYQLSWLSRVIADAEWAYRVLEEEYGAWQGETGLRRPEAGHPQG